MPFITSPDPEFLSQIDELESGSKAAAEATRLEGQRKWMYPPLNGWTGCPLDITDMNKAFVRDQLNELYKKILADKQHKGTVGEAMAAKLQVDYIAALERAFRTRHCSSVRAKLHASSRRKAMGDAQGVFTGSVVMWIERLLFAAHDDPFAAVKPGEAPNE